LRLNAVGRRLFRKQQGQLQVLFRFRVSGHQSLLQELVRLLRSG
jgi:hypothetical protein